MKKLAILSLVLFLLFSLKNYGQDNFTRSVNKSQVSFKLIKQSKGQLLPEKELFNNKYFALILVNENTVFSDKEKLAESGVTIHQNIGNDIYWVSIEADKLNNLTNSKIVKGIAGSTQVNKFEAELRKFELPEYALNNDSTVNVILTYFGELLENEMIHLLKQKGCNGVRLNPTFNQIKCVIPKNKVTSLEQIPWIASINIGNRKMKHYSMQGNKRHGTKLFNFNDSEFNLTGKGVNVGVWDANSEEHMDMLGRVHIQESRIEGYDHGIHVSGILAGNGLLNPIAQGVAPEANLYTYNYDGGDNDDLVVGEEMLEAAENFDISITQNSYGLMNLGGILLPYLPEDANLDIVANLHPNILHVFAVGNNRVYYEYNTATTNAKNIISVANIDMEGYRSPTSSFGPTAGGHLLPHIAAYGTNVFSTSYLNGYSTKSGTSMSAPLVSGAAAQMVQLYREKFDSDPSATLLKALMCNTASDIDLVGPDYKSGYGILNQKKALESLNKEEYIEGTVNDNEEQKFSFNVPSGTKEFRVMLVWNDPWTYPTMNNPLVNNLNLVVKKDGKKYNPWRLDPNNPDQAATQNVNVLDNMEQVLINDPEPGLYEIIVNGYGISLSDEDGKQEFSLAYTYIKPELELFSPVVEEVLDFNTDLFGNQLCELLWFSYGLEGSVSVELSIDGGTTFNEIASLHEEDVYYAFELPDSFTPEYQVRIKQGGIYSESKIIKAMKTPEIAIEQTGLTTAEITWNAIDGATEYKVFSIFNGELTELAIVNTNTYTISNLSGDEIYYAVQATNTNMNISSLRSAAVKPDITLAISALPFYEDFEGGGLEFFTEKTGIGELRPNRQNNNTTIYIQGAHNNGPSDYKLDNEKRFNDYSDWVSSLTTGSVTIPEGKKTVLALDLRLEKMRVYVGDGALPVYSYFRVMVNGDSIREISSKYEEFGDNYELSYAGNLNYEHQSVGIYFNPRRVYYDLSAYAGQEIKIKLEALVPFNTIAEIDNIAIEEIPAHDIAIIEKVQIPSGIELEDQPVKVQVANMGSNSISSFTLSYTIDKGLAVDPITETFNIALDPMESAWVTFSTLAKFAITNFSHSVEVRVSENDDNSLNNTVVIDNIDNYQQQVPMYYDNATIVVSDTILFTDGGGDRYMNEYFAGQTNFIPADSTKVLKMEFIEFDIHEGDDFRIYSGVFGGDGLIDTMKVVHYTTAITNPLAVTSTSPSGGFLVHWRGYSSIKGKGWKINITEVDPIIQTDISIRAINSPVTHTDLMSPVPVEIELWNFGRSAIETVDVSYKIDEFPEIIETITFTEKLKANQRYIHTFNTLANLTTFGNTYDFTVSVDLSGDQDLSSNTVTEVIKNTYPLTQFEYAPRVYLYNMYFDDYFYQAPWWYSYDKSDEILYVEYNNSYKIDILAGGSSPYYGHNYEIAAQVDWNDDGDFDDIAEKTLIPVYDEDDARHVGYLKVPNDAKPGKKRFRINTYAFAYNGELRQGNQTDFSLYLTGNPTIFDVAISEHNLMEYAEPSSFTPEVTIEQIGSENTEITVSMTIGENYTQISKTTIDVNDHREFIFPEIELNEGSFPINVTIEQGDDATPENNSVSFTTQVYNFNPSFLSQEKGVSHFDFSNPKMNLLRVESPHIDSLGYFFGTFAKDSFYVYKRELINGGHSVSLVKMDTSLTTEQEVYNYKYGFNDILGVAYADNSNEFFTLSSLTRNREIYMTQKYNFETMEIENIDTIQANGFILQNLACLASDTEGNLYTIFKPQNILCNIEKGTGELKGMAIIPADLKNATDIALELDKNTGNFVIGVENKLYELKPMSRMATYIGSLPVNAYGIGLKYKRAKAESVAALRAFRAHEQTTASTINSVTKNIDIEVDWNADLTNLTPDVITVNGGSAKINGVNVVNGITKIDLSTPGTLVVTSFDGNSTETWTINAKLRTKTELNTFSFTAVRNSGISEDISALISENQVFVDVPTDVELSSLIANFTTSAGSKLYLGEKAIFSGITSVNYSNNVVLTVKSNDNIDQINYIVRINRVSNTDAYISNYRLLSIDNPNLDKDYIATNIDNTLYLGFDDTTQVITAIAQFDKPAGAIVTASTGIQESGISTSIIEHGSQYKVVSEDGASEVIYTINLGKGVGVEFSDLHNFSFYPNPARNFVYINNAKGSYLRVINMSGQTVFYTNIVSNEQQIDLNHLHGGIYLFKLLTSNVSKEFKIVIEN